MLIISLCREVRLVFAELLRNAKHANVVKRGTAAITSI